MKKHILESKEVFEAYASIDLCYLALEKIFKGMEMDATHTPLDRMIDEATGYGKEKYAERKQEAVDLLKEVINSKKIIGADYKGDEKFLMEINKIKE